MADKLLIYDDWNKNISKTKQLSKKFLQFEKLFRIRETKILSPYPFNNVWRSIFWLLTYIGITCITILSDIAIVVGSVSVA